ncbi:glutathione binding-like protein [Rhodanobacter sp. Root480]|uniref:glutathione binding-like protein n=1 Tax=Rhodanobacter sp. Root480 TaxID=1736542 RepID=UPI000ACCFFE6|nr:glutathione binding-like protein [Rhodanobacter sp. Root480]
MPTLTRDNGEVLTEGTAIIQYLADLKPESGLAPANGTLPRYRLQEMLGYINSELHKNYSPLFSPDTTDQVRQQRKDYLLKRYALLNDILAGQPYLLGNTFTAADAYLFTITNWAGHVGLDLSQFAALADFQQRVASRPAVQAAMVAEGLIEKAA